MNKNKEMNRILFSVLTPEEIKKLSEVEVLTYKSYDRAGAPVLNGICDPRFGTIKEFVSCATCDKTAAHCSGHFGHYELIRPVLNINYLQKIKQIAQLICFHCSRCLLSDEQRKKISSNNDFRNKIVLFESKKLATCPFCSAKINRLSFSKILFSFLLGSEKISSNQMYELFEKIDPKDNIFFELAESIPPKNLYIRLLLVPPIQVRPHVYAGTNEKSEDDLTYKLTDIIRTDLKLRECIQTGSPQLILQDIYELLEYHVATYFNNQVSFLPSSKHRSGKILSTFVQRIKGKEGRFRFNLSGKRVNYSARATIVPDPNLKITDVGIPDEIAKSVFLKELVSVNNIDKIKKNILEPKEYAVKAFFSKNSEKLIFEENKQLVLDKLAVGDFVSRTLVDGDFVLFNRQPTLHRYSIFGLRVCIHKEKVLKLNPALCAIFNADFDGDEMNIHVPQTIEAYLETKYLLSPINARNMFSIGNGRLVFGAKEDIVSNLFYLTYDNPYFSKDETEYILKDTLLEQQNKKVSSGMHGLDIVSLILPKCINLEYSSKLEAYTTEKETNKHVKIVNGQMISGVLDSKSISESGILMKEISFLCTPEELIKTIHDLFSIGRNLNELEGYSISLSDFEIPSQLRKEISSYNPPKQVQTIETEDEQIEVINENKTYLDQVLKKNIVCSNPFYSIVLSGARGSIMNFNNISATIGQQFFSGRRYNQISSKYIGRNFSHAPFKKELMWEGYIWNSYRSGLNPIEYFVHASSGREGLIDTAIKTASTGYTQRKLIFSMEGIKIDKNLSAVDGEGKIFQYVYGVDGIDPAFDQFKERIEDKTKILIQEGTSIGILTAQSFGEPLSQMTLRTFHSAGADVQSSFSSTITELVQLLENKLLQNEEKINVFSLKKEYSEQKKIMSFLEKIKSRFLIEYVEFSYSKDNLLCVQILNLDYEKKIKQIFEKIILDPSEYSFSIGRVDFLVKKKHKDVLKIKEQLEKIQCAGLKNFEKIKIYEKKDKYFFEIRGPILKQIYSLEEVDKNSVFSNCPKEIYSMFGIEGVRAHVFDQINLSFKNNGLYINEKHVHLICDILCHSGEYSSITRTGVITQKKSPLFRASFEIATTQLIQAALSEEEDALAGATENILIGQTVPLGTGYFDAIEKI